MGDTVPTPHTGTSSLPTVLTILEHDDIKLSEKGVKSTLKRLLDVEQQTEELSRVWGFAFDFFILIKEKVKQRFIFSDRNLLGFLMENT